MKTKALLLTGATGFLGRYLLRDLLLADVPVVALVRSNASHSASERLERILSDWDHACGFRIPRPVCMAGDVNHDRLGLSPSQFEWLKRDCRQMIHGGASLVFTGRSREDEPWTTNLDGTRRVLEFCEEADIAQLHYVSTAYVCGLRHDRVYEHEFEHNNRFRNDYEQSKYEAERLVRQASFLDGPTITRPTFIVGDSATGYTSTYHGPYRYFQFTWMLQQQVERDRTGRWHHPVRLNLTGLERLNLVPVDWVSAMITHIVRHPRLRGKVYHLAPHMPSTTGMVEAALARYFNYYGVSFVGPESLPDEQSTPVERFFYEYVSQYLDYWRSEPSFDSRNATEAAPQLICPQVDQPMLCRFIEFAVRHRWGKGPATNPRRRPRQKPQFQQTAAPPHTAD